ncbi:MAG: hypothetical protein D6826_07300 [Alphaproteobacteria bacterium]|nr:MAG: hypothetical protein D6826_07300 [Alphaproteobacteria bacterium]
MIREALAEEIGRLRGSLGGAFAPTTPRPQVREEVVSIRSDAELMAFVHRLLELAKDGRTRQEIESGRWVFRLHASGVGAASPLPSGRPGAPAGGAVAQFTAGLVSERQIDALPPGTSRLVIGRRVRFTPLARDRIRQRGIEIERME